MAINFERRLYSPAAMRGGNLLTNLKPEDEHRRELSYPEYFTELGCLDMNIPQLALDTHKAFLLGLRQDGSHYMLTLWHRASGDLIETFPQEGETTEDLLGHIIYAADEYTAKQSQLSRKDRKSDLYRANLVDLTISKGLPELHLSIGRIVHLEAKSGYQEIVIGATHGSRTVKRGKWGRLYPQIAWGCYQMKKAHIDLEVLNNKREQFFYILSRYRDVLTDGKNISHLAVGVETAMNLFLAGILRIEDFETAQVLKNRSISLAVGKNLLDELRVVAQKRIEDEKLIHKAFIFSPLSQPEPKITMQEVVNQIQATKALPFVIELNNVLSQAIIATDGTEYAW